MDKMTKPRSVPAQLLAQGDWLPDTKQMVCEAIDSHDGNAHLTLMGPGKSGPHKLTVPRGTTYRRQRPNPLYLLRERVLRARKAHGHASS